ncbi:MAG: cell wall-active antibiotics response protein LiaF [Sporolactobacillus sp.]
MFRSFKSDHYSWLLVAGLFALVLQTVFGDWGFLIPATLFGILFYYGKKHFDTRSGKLLFFIGLIALALILISTLFFRITVLIAFLFFAYDFVQTKRRPLTLRPDRATSGGATTHASFIRATPGNKWFGRREHADGDYEWQDMNFQLGAGDIVLDLSRTILPNKEALVVIRHFAGRVRILVPFGVETSVRYSVVCGSLNFFGSEHCRMINESVAVQTDHYAQEEQKLAIIISAVAGTLEVKRI